MPKAVKEDSVSVSQKKEAKKGSFSVNLLNDSKKKDFEFVQIRIQELQKNRQLHYGINLDNLWNDADRDYVPHRISGKGKRVIASDEDKGWRGQRVILGASDWQSDVSQANVYTKIQTALSILIDQNPSGVFKPGKKEYQAANEIIRQLYERSWESAKSKEQLKLFVFNLAKYGWAAGRTFPLRLTRKVKVLKEYNQDEPEKSVYEEKEVVEYNDVMRENLDTRNTWLDDLAKPSNQFSVKDWCFRKVYDMDAAEQEFGKYDLWQYVSAGGNTQEVVNSAEKGQSKQVENKNLVEIYFYENRAKDLLMIIANGVPIVIEPLPIADPKGFKKLSLWQTYWNLRHTESPYGIGIYEAIRYDQSILDRLRNMTVDQITMSIYKMFFYQGTQSLENTGDIKITPGVGKQVLDPKNISWMEVPGPGKDAYLGIEMFRNDVDEASGITDPLIGVVTGKTAFEIAQAKESALKRLKNPLENILEALNTEGYITVSLIQLLYSVPEVYKIADTRLIEDYLKEIKGDPELFERTPKLGEDKQPMTDPMTGELMMDFTAKVYPEFQLNLDKDEKGNLIENPDSRFFRVKPSTLGWEGIISIKPQSLLSPSKQVDKALELEMYNMLIPLMQTIAQERLMKTQTGQDVNLDELTNGKTVKEIIKLYDKDPRDILPDSWLQETEQPLFVGPPQVGPDGAPLPPPENLDASQGADQLVSSIQAPANPPNLVGQISAKAAAPFRI